MLLGDALKDVGARFAALVLRTDSRAGILVNRGNALRDLKRPEDALAMYERALRLKPDFAEALNSRGKTQLELGRPEDALASHDSAIRLKPDYAEAFYYRGNALLHLKRLDEALASYEGALRLKPDYADAHYNRGIVLQRLRRAQEALESYDRALELRPDDAEALNNRGNVLIDLKQPDLAVGSYERALSYRPDYANACYNLGLALQDVNRPAEAVPYFSRVLELVGDYPFAKGKLLHAKMLCCDWDQLPQLRDAIEADVGAGKNSCEPFEYQAISGSARQARLCAEMYAATNFPPSRLQLWAGERYDNPRIRIGYVAGEFREHATALLITGLLERHDKRRFETFAFDNGWDDESEIRGRINRAVDEIVDITRLDDPQAAATIRGRKIDILVDLNGYVGRERQGIFCYRPCPIQVNYLGFPGTLGADYFDYILADPHVIPPQDEAFYNERIVYLPDTYQVNDSKRRIAERIPGRAEAGLPEAGFIFCCFNKNYKITPEIFDVWMRLLRKVGGSVLWLLEDNLAASRNLKREAERRGIAADRLVFAGRMKSDEHLARHRAADLFLDTLPINAHTTASDSLWAGLPVLTCVGQTFPGRVAASLLNAVGLPELVTHDLESYEARALELATRPAGLLDIKARLDQNRATHPLFDTDRFRLHIESAYATMWERAQRGEPPSSFSVKPIS